MDERPEASNIYTGKLVDAKELARHLHLDVTLVRKMAKTRRIPCLNIKNGARSYYRFRIAEVEAALRKL